MFYRGGKIVCSEQVKFNSTGNNIQFVNRDKYSDCFIQALHAFKLGSVTKISGYEMNIYFFNKLYSSNTNELD
jgi:hypothetical protein